MIGVISVLLHSLSYFSKKKDLCRPKKEPPKTISVFLVLLRILKSILQYSVSIIRKVYLQA
jgi:hypothetical protein